MNVGEVGLVEASSPTVSSQNGKYACPEQSESGQIPGTGSVFGEPSEQRHQLGSEIIGN
jgi:hypothetical protein